MRSDEHSSHSLSRPENSDTVLWSVVRTKPRQENVAVTNLARQGYEAYMPMIRLEKLRRRKKELVEEPMFPAYLFVRISGYEPGRTWVPIRSTTGVKQLVRFGGQPAKVDERLIDALRARELAQQDRPAQLFTPGERVLLVEGPFAGIEAVYRMEDAAQRCMVLLEILSRPVQVRLGLASVRKVG